MFGLQLIVAILPCMAIVYLIYRADRYEKEDLLPLFYAFLLGALITLPLAVLQLFFHHQGWLAGKTLWAALVASFLLVAFVEETLKFMALRSYPFLRPFFNEPIDGIVYAMVIAMGFATVENVLYAYWYELPTTLIRGITAVPAHASFAAIMGYYVGRARFQPLRRRRLLQLGLLLPVGVHGLYDFFILQEVYEGLMVLSVLTLSTALFFSIRLVRQQQASSPFREKSPGASDDED